MHRKTAAGRIADHHRLGLASGGNLSEPVVQNTLRITKVFWGLDDTLAHRRHFPAINWLLSYSLYLDNLKDYFSTEVSEEFLALREKALKLLAQEAELEEIVRLVGLEALSPKEQLILFTSKLIREDFLYQSAFDPVDQYSSFKKQYLILKQILTLNELAGTAIETGVSLEEINNLEVVGKIARARLSSEDEIQKLETEIRESLRRKHG